MAYVTPIIAGSVLLSFGFASAFMRIEISSTLMIVMVLGAVLVSLRDIRKFQLTKEGFVLERAETTERPERPKALPNSEWPKTVTAEVQRGATATTSAVRTERLKRGLFALGFFYAVVSGVLSVFVNEAMTDWFARWPLLLASPTPALCYSTVLILLLLKLRAIGKLQLFVLVPLVVYGAWCVAFFVAFLLLGLTKSVPAAGPAITGFGAGLIGALLLGIGLSIFIKALRATTAIAVTGAVGAVTGLLLAAAPLLSDTTVKVGTAEMSTGFYPVFIGWQAAVTLAIIFFMTAERKFEGISKSSASKP